MFDSPIMYEALLLLAPNQTRDRIGFCEIAKSRKAWNNNDPNLFLASQDISI